MKDTRSATKTDRDGGKRAAPVDFCVIGAGAGGLAVAAAAAAFGQRVVLIEKHKMGGDGLNYGCVPSKALLAAGKRAEAMRSASRFGIKSVEPVIDNRSVHDYVRNVIAAIAPNQSVERYTGMGVQVITAAGRFVDGKTVVAGEHRVTARWFVVATGSAPVVPAIDGLQDVPYFTNETIFDASESLPHLIIIGGGSTGLELAQAHRRLGCVVTVLETGTCLLAEDPELSAVVVKRLRTEGVTIREGARINNVSGTTGEIRVTLAGNGDAEVITGTHVLVATGRKPNTADLGLDAAGIAHDKKGITVSPGLVTSNKRIFAIGDVAGGLKFTHIASDDAGIVIRGALFRLPAKTTGRIAPRVTYTDPELAHVGMSEAEARAKHGKIGVLRWPYQENDRAQIEKTTDGHIKVVTDKRGYILGATIAGAQAGEIIQIWTLAISQRLKIKAMSEVVSPYPSYSEINKRAAFRSLVTMPGNPFVRKIIATLAKLG